MDLNTFSQLVWGASKEVGCGWAYCSEIVGNPDTTPPTIVANAYYFACNYGPQYVSMTGPGFSRYGYPPAHTERILHEINLEIFPL